MRRSGDKTFVAIVTALGLTWALIVCAAIYFDPAHCDPDGTWSHARCTAEQP